MRRLLVFSLVFSLVLGCLGAYVVPTSKGDIELTVPDGYTLEEAYIEMARLYLEERWDHEKLLEETSLLTKELNIYIEENKTLRTQYNNILMSYAKIDELYAELTKVKPISSVITGSMSYDMINRATYLNIGGGWNLYEILDITAGLSTSFSLGTEKKYNNTSLNLNVRYVFE